MKAIIISLIMSAFFAVNERPQNHPGPASNVPSRFVSANARCAPTADGLTITLNNRNINTTCVYPGQEYTVCISGSSCNYAYLIEPSIGYTVTDYEGGRDATNGTACGIKILIDAGATEVNLQVKALGMDYWTPAQPYCVKVCGSPYDCF